VSAGVDVLMRQRLDLVRGRRVGLVTNQTGVDRHGRSTIDLLHGLADVRLTALFSPEHGIRGDAAAGERVASSTHGPTGLPVYSLYGPSMRPTPRLLAGLDTLVFDIQDVGARVYTYISTLLECLRAGAGHVAVVVLDRPVPINGNDVEGNVVDERFASFVGPPLLAMRYGMTIGELACLFNAEFDIGADLTVVPLAGWHRTDWYDQTGLAWVDPSPNIRSLTAATLYPGTVLVEGTNLSEGRGTGHPFEWIGAPWLDGAAWADALNALEAPGVRFAPVRFTPTMWKFAGTECGGVQIEVVDRSSIRPMALGVTLLATARRAGGQLRFTQRTFDALAGTDGVRSALEHGQPASEIASAWTEENARFRAIRARYLLY
jgi:uncharacterized protein YbbC (DUF1343 family)